MILMLSLFACAPAYSWEEYEHQQVSDSAFFTVMQICCRPSGDSAFVPIGSGGESIIPLHLRSDMTFGQVVAGFAGDDLARNRFHDYGRSIQEQLEMLTAEQIEAAWNAIKDSSSNQAKAIYVESAMSPPKFFTKNTISAYLLYHMLAMRMAKEAGASVAGNRDHLLKAMILEAIAQGHLADAFSAGHILTPVSDFLAPLHCCNTIESHNYHRSKGVYVVNSRGDAWQTFGDKLMHWYAPTYRPVFEACYFSLMEIMTVYYNAGDSDLPDGLEQWNKSTVPGVRVKHEVSIWTSGHDGDYFYTHRYLPTLMLLPMPTAATWSIRTYENDEHNIRKRRHFPQLYENGFHDPDDWDIDKNFLYSRNDIPAWLIPPGFLTDNPVSPDSLIKFHPDWASVRWHQIRYAPPSYKGLLLGFGSVLLFENNDGHGRTGGMVRLGYGLWDDLMLLKNISLNTTLLPSAYDEGRLLLATSLGLGIPSLMPKYYKALHLEGGAAFGLRSQYNDHGVMLTAGIDSNVLPFGFTNAGLTFRLKYQWFLLGRIIHGPALEVILQ